MAQGFKELAIGLILAGLFIFAFINFGIEIANENNVNATLLQDPTINKSFGALQGNLSTAEGTAKGQRESFEREDVATGFGTLVSFTVISAARSFTSMFTALYDIAIGIPAVALGIPPIVLGIITTILMIMLIFLAWRVFKAGE